MLRRLRRALIFCLPPLAAGLLLRLEPTLPGLHMFSLIACAYSVIAIGLMALTWRTSTEVKAMASTVAGLEHDLWKQRMALQTQIEILCAEREIGLIVREDVDFKAIVERTLRVMGGLLGPESVIEVHVGESLRAVWAEGKAWFDRGLTKRAKIDGSDLLDIKLPLHYDGDEIGSVRMRANLQGDFEEREERARLLTLHSDELAGFLALALKTPDLYTRAIQDGLTGLATKRHFLTQIDTLCESAKRDGTMLSLVMIDIDHFKKVNDKHGHLTGDKVLKGVADVLRRSIRARAGDAAYSSYRYGGEELSILLPRVTLAKAAQIAERVRAAIEEKDIAGVPVTASLGVAQLEGSMSPEQLVQAADAALYRAKESGRNRVMVAETAKRAVA